MDSIWCENSPDSLVDITARFCANNLLRLAGSDKDISKLELPHEIGEKLFMTACDVNFMTNCELNGGVTDKLVEMFRHQRMTRASLRGCSLSDKGVKMVIRHKLRELDIHNCPQFTVSILVNFTHLIITDFILGSDTQYYQQVF